ncbi:MAG: sulfite exporter TauE/SafE family protein [Cyanobacteria bacterium K_DeepCast_35m_m2_023]|nr:sulfite exporter TauE/SafE family protein [Cyanobacteria bacterium K_DeepCast_35m_m2_023]
MELTLSSLLPLVPLALLGGVLSGLLGIGGGLIFSPLLLLLGVGPHQALATSSLAIVLTTFGGSWSHLRSRSLPLGPSLAIGSGAAFSSALFSSLGEGLSSGLLLGMQAAMYGVLTVVIRPSALVSEAHTTSPAAPWALALVGLVAGLAGGLLGLGGGLVMVPLMVSLLGQPVRLAVRLSTLAVLVSALVAAPVFISDGRGLVPVALVLGSVAALGARWSASRLNKVPERAIVALLRTLTALLALDSGRRAVLLPLG